MNYDNVKYSLVKRLSSEVNIINNFYFFCINNTSNFLKLLHIQNYIINNEINNEINNKINEDLIYITVLFDIFFDNYTFFIKFVDSVNIKDKNNASNLLCFFGVNNLLLTYFNKKLSEMLSEEECKKIIYRIITLSSDFIKNKNINYEKSFKCKLITIFSDICFYNL
tara:strand:+ start:80 stop:580 length:501 start_codon:yes stop_codon:yes gene_type:complete